MLAEAALADFAAKKTALIEKPNLRGNSLGPQTIFCSIECTAAKFGPLSRRKPATAEGWAAVAEGQTETAELAKGRANSELRDSPTRAKRGAAPKNSKTTAIS